MKHTLSLRKNPKLTWLRYCMVAMLSIGSVSNVVAQCLNTIQFGSAALPTTVGQTVTITTCAFDSEYSVGTGCVAGYTYQFNCTPATAYLTVRTGTYNGTAVAWNTQGFQWTSNFTGTIYIHMKANSACGTGGGCYAPSVTLISTAPPCNSAPVGGTAVATPSQTTYCGTASPTLSITGGSGPASGISFQWQSSPDGATWTNITGATAATYAVPAITVSTLYRRNTTCANTVPASTTPSSPILINVAPLPVVGTTSSAVAICQGGSATLTGTGASSYSWQPGGATTPSITVSPTSTTTYTVTGTLGSCSNTATRTLTVGTPFTITPVTATPASVCSGGSTVLSATVPTPNNTFCAATHSSGTGSGDYCSLVHILGTTLNNPSAGSGSPYYTLYPTSGNTTATLTAGTTYTITLGTGTYSNNDIAAFIDWNYNGSLDDPGEKLGQTDGLGSGGQTSFVFTVPASTPNGLHRLRVRETDNSIAIGACTALSWGETEDYNITITGGVPFAAVTWTESIGGGTTLAGTTTVPVNANNITTNKTYGISVTKDGCTATGSVSVVANPLPTATMTTSTPTVCAGQQPSITITGTPNTNVVYSINGADQPAVSTGGSGSVTFTPPAITTATAYALVSATTPATTCSSTLTGGFTVNVNERPAGVFLGSSTVCKDNPAFIGFGSPSGASVFPIYATFTDGTNTYVDTAYGAGENFPVPSNVPGIYNYTLVSLTSGNNGCAAIAADMNGTATMEVKALPTAVVTSQAPGVCPGSSTDVTLTFTGDAPFNFNYFDGTTSQGGSSATNTYTFTVTPATATDYYVENLLDNNFCVATPADLADTATVVVYDTTTITSQPIAAITACSETSATITMTAIGENLTYTWYENGTPVSGPNFTVNNNILTINNVTGLDGNQYYVVVHSDCGNDQTSNSTTINEDHTNNWSGTVSTDWNNGANWSCGSVPIITTDVFIPMTAPNQPVVEMPNAVCHDLTLVGNTASLTFVPGMQLSVYGDIMNTTGGTINGSGAKLVLAGTVQNAAGPLTLNDLDVTGGGVKTFTNDVTVGGILNLVSGNIELGTANLTMEQPSSVTGGSPTSFIVTNGTGKVTGNNMGAVGGNAAPATFHVGISNTSYTPVTLENLGDADNFSVRVMENVYEDGTGTIPTEVTNPVVDRTWLVEEAVAGGSYVNMTPSWNSPSDETNGFVTTNVFVAHYMGGEWTSYVDSALAAPAADPGAFPGMLQTTQDSIMNFSPFTVASSGQFPLAIRLSSITATNAGPRNKVQWTSSKEDAGDMYELESSADGRKFTRIATVAAKGEASTYLHWDEQPVQGVNYYRVKLLNNDGTYSYSKIVTATVSGKDGFSIEAYPNPVKNMVSVKVDGVVAANAKVVVTDVTGKVVKAATEVVNNGAEINVSDLAAGVYLLNYSDDVRNESIKINKQ